MDKKFGKFIYKWLVGFWVVTASMYIVSELSTSPLGGFWRGASVFFIWVLLWFATHLSVYGKTGSE